MVIRCWGHTHQTYLVDDGTLDTVINVDGRVLRYSQEYAADYRNARGELKMRKLLTESAEVACLLEGMEDDDA